MTSLLASSLLALACLGSGANADPFSSELTVLGQDALIQLQETEADLYNTCGQLSFGDDISPANGILVVNTERCGQLSATADLILTYATSTDVITWAWEKEPEKQWSTHLSQTFLARTDEPGFSELARPSLRVAGPEVAYSVAAINILTSGAQVLQTFPQGADVSYVLLTFDEVPE